MFRNTLIVLFSLFCLSTSAFSAEIKIPSFDAKKHCYLVNSTWKSFLTDAQIAAICQKLVDLKEPAYFVEYSAGPRSQYEAEWFRGKVLSQWKKRGFNDAEWSLVIVGHHPDTLVVSVPTMLGKNFRPVADSSAITFQAKALGYLTDMSNHVAGKKAEAKAESDRIAAEVEAKAAREKKERDEAKQRLTFASALLIEEETILSVFVFNETALHDKTRSLLEKVKSIDRNDMLSVLSTSSEVVHHLSEVRKQKELNSQQVTRWILFILGGLVVVGLVVGLSLKARRSIVQGKKFHQRLGVVHERLIQYSRKIVDGVTKERFTGETKKQVDFLLRESRQLMVVSFVAPQNLRSLDNVITSADKIESAIRNSEGDFHIDLRSICDHWFFLYLLSNDREIKMLSEVKGEDPCSYSPERVTEIRVLYSSIAESLKKLGNAQAEQYLGEVNWQNISREEAVHFLAGLIVRQDKAVQRRR